MLEIGDHSNDLRQLGMNLPILLKQAINRLVRRLELGEQSMRNHSRNYLLAKPGHMVLDQILEVPCDNVQDDEAGIVEMGASSNLIFWFRFG